MRQPSGEPPPLVVLARWLIVLPAFVFVGAALALLLWWSRPVRHEALIRSYNARLRQALAAGKLDLAYVSARRLEQLTGYAPETRYRTALILEARGETSLALDIMQELASKSASGYPAAHLWLAKKMLSNSRSSGSTLDAARWQLEQMLQTHSLERDRGLAAPSPLDNRPGISAELLEAQRLLAKVYQSLGHSEKAIALLEATGDTDLETSYTLAVLNRSMGNDEKARLWARRILRQVKTSQGEKPDDDALCIWKARAYMLLDEYEAAVEAVRAHSESEMPPVRDACLSEVYFRWAESRERQQSSDANAYVELLLSSLNHSPVYPLTYARLADLAARPAAQRQSIERSLERALARGDSAAAVGLLLGNIAWADGDLARARKHYQSAFVASPQAAAIASNLAWALAHADPPLLAVALELSDRAVQENPGVAEFRNTRGQILVKLERWAEAVAELEEAKAGMSPSRELFQALAAAYRARGQSEQATLAEQEIKRLDNEKAESLLPVETDDAGAGSWN